MNRVFRIIDANINRAKEGLRVVEDICRYILDDEELTDRVKNIRHQLTELIKIPNALLVESRGSDEDVARQRSVPKRKSTRDVFAANAKRATEAIRVMEEFLDNGDEIKDLRYLVYDLEKVILQKLRLKLPFENDLYVVSDSVEIIKKAIDDGAAIVQLRDKSEDMKAIKEKGLTILNYIKDPSAIRQAHGKQSLGQVKDVIFILNDHPELAKEIGADGVHLGQKDMKTEAVREIVGEDFIIGRSTHSFEQGLAAQNEDINYISVGPVYETPTKPGRKAVGLVYVKEAAVDIAIPFVTIGGINMKNIDEVLGAGATTIGIVRAVDQVGELLKKVRG